VIELVVPKSSTAQGLPAEEQQQPEDHDVEDKANEEYPPLSDIEVESFGVEAPVPTGSLRSLLEHLGITTTPRYRIQEVPHPGWVEFKAIADTRDQLLGPLVATLLLTPPDKPSPHGSVATRVGCRTPSTTSCPIGRRINSRPMG
jgi:hypothetical protein